uniref:Uncharacterized protein n=1 Tax=viral metagenome TaxID=1070528 RepID=A0A6H2A2B4_9ZZZZ
MQKLRVFLMGWVHLMMGLIEICSLGHISLNWDLKFHWWWNRQKALRQ